MISTRYIPLFAPLVLAGCVTGHHAGAPEGAVDVIAHRGASAYAPDNTLAAFRKAMELGADWFELDCHLTRDGALVVMHNGDVDDTTDGTGPIAGKTLAELKKLDAGSWFDPAFAGERVPTLAEALDLAKDRIGVYVEIKGSGDDRRLMDGIVRAATGHKELTPALKREISGLIEDSRTRNLELTRKTIAEIRARHMKHQVVVQSFSPVVCFIARTEAPDLRTEFLGSDPKDEPGRWPQYLEFGYLIDTAGFNINHEALTSERLAGFHQVGKSVAVWTVDDEALIRQYAQAGVDAIITNKPDVCVRVLKEAGKR